jgi:hypothetical protein
MLQARQLAVGVSLSVTGSCSSSRELVAGPANRELLWLRHGDSSRTQSKRKHPPLEAVTIRLLKTVTEDASNSEM